MKKKDFVLALEKRLKRLPREELNERINFYCEMIDDKIEEGLSEAAAVQSVGSVDTIAGEICEQIRTEAYEKKKEKRPLRAWEVALLIIGSPVWGAILIAIAAVLFSVWMSVWAVNITLWAVELPFLVFSKIFLPTI